VSASKFSISLPKALGIFVESYRKRRGLKRAQVFEEAIKLLRERELEHAYRAAAAEYDKAWDTTTSDGLGED
jgi:antitoxin ParD1/3/4